MTDLDQNVDAYQILADLMVTIRRIIRRGLEKASGKTWYLDGLPDGLFERLVARKEREAAIDRFGGEYQELITYASLDDLAATIEHNAELRKLLAALESEGTPIIERLREIEALRLKLAASVPFDDDELETLIRYHQEFRDSLTRRKHGAGEATPEPSPEPADTSATGGATAEPRNDEPTGRSEPDDEHGETAGTTSAAGSGPPAHERPDQVPRGREFSTQAATFEELVEVVGGVRPAGGRTESNAAGEKTGKAAIEDARTRAAKLVADAIGEDAPETGTVERRAVDRENPPERPTTLDAERAMAADDDREVLAVLHREITFVADRAFDGGLDADHPVWEAVRSSGWYDLKKSDLALAPLELFRQAESQDADRESIRELLRESGFSKLLLSLREIFLRHSGRE
jgi:hypothetical protein